MPASTDIYDQALALGRGGRAAEAIALLQDSAELIANDVRAQGLLGTLLAMTGRPAEALAAFERSIALDPHQPVVHSDMGNALTALERPVEAMAAFDRALALDPGHGPALHNRAGLLLVEGRAEAALADTQRALTFYPNRATAHRYHAHALYLLERHEEALPHIAEALRLDDAPADAHALGAAIMTALGRFEDALAAIERAVARQPADVHEHTFTRALNRLRLGDWGGWDDYEQRWLTTNLFKRGWNAQIDTLAARATRLSPEDFVGKRVLLAGEQGVGDQIMFASMIPEVQGLAANVTVVADPRLQSLLAHSFPQVRAIYDLEEARRTSFDMMVPMGGLPHAFRRRGDAFPGTPYLRPWPETVQAWRERLGPRQTRLRVGLSWRGGSVKTGRSARSVDLAELTPLLARADCEFVSLQYGKVAGEVDEVNAALASPVRYFPRDEIENFEHLAGLVEALDLVVSVQTSLIHLCGALGAPCLVMIPSNPEWRYGATGKTMPWYHSVELFRQTSPGDWGPVIAAIGAELDRRQIRSA
jgi:tetratricopeptide (TPR) repeat protein